MNSWSRLPSGGGQCYCARYHDWDLPSQVVSVSNGELVINNVGLAEYHSMSIFWTRRCAYFSSRCRRLVRVDNMELRLKTYGRQSSMPTFWPNHWTRKRFVSTVNLWWTLISCADLLLLHTLVGICGAFGSVGYTSTLVVVYTSRVFSVCMECFRKVLKN